MTAIAAGVGRRRVAVVALLVVLAGGVVWYLTENAHEFARALGMVDTTTLLLVALLRLAGLTLTVKAAVALLAAHAPRLGFGEYLLVTTAGIVAGKLSPGGSSLSKAVYLNRRHGLPLMIFGGLQATFLLSILACACVVSMLGLVALGFRGQSGLWPLWLLAAAGVAGVFVPQLMRGAVLSRLAGVAPFLRPAVDAWRAGAEPSRLLRRVWPWLLLRAGVGFCAMAWLFTAFTGNIDAALAGGTLEGLAVACNLVPVTPGNLGFYEWVVALLGGQLGFPLTSALAVALTYRVLGLTAGLAASAVVAAHRHLLVRPRHG